MKFFHVINSKRGSGITLVAEITEQNTVGISYLVKCAVSYCAPCEANFSRPKGRTIAFSRLTSNKPMPPFKQFSFTTNDQQGLKTQILEQLVNTLPLDWARSLVDRELARLEEVQRLKDVQDAG